MRKKRFIYNNDGTFLLCNSLHGGRTLTPKDVEDYVDLVAGTQVTSFFICTNSSMPYYKSLHDRAIGCLNPDTAPGDGGHPNEPDNCELYGQNLTALLEHGTDIVELCVDRAHARGMEGFASMRMNDLHFNDPAIRYPFGQGDFWLEHPEYYVGDADLGWHADGALDFAEAEVREYKLDMIQEICERFDIDGIDLDFMRFPVYFRQGEVEDNIPVMTDFLRAVRAVVNTVGEKRGRAIELGVRLPARVDLCRKIGFEPVTYTGERLVDFITITPFLFNFASVPVEAFREELCDDSIPIYAGIMSFEPGRNLSHGAFRASAANCFREGADGLYLFNFFYHHNEPEPIRLFCVGACRTLLEELGDPALLRGRNKIYSAGVQVSRYGTGLDYVLPSSLKPGEILSVGIELSEDVSAKLPGRALLFVRVRGEGDWPATWNNEPVAQIVDIDATSAFGLDARLEEDAAVHVYELQQGELAYGTNVVTVQAPVNSGGEVLRADVAIEYGGPERYGYF